MVEEAGGTEGSFSNHFGAKEGFAIEILDLYFTDSRTMSREKLRDDSLLPLKRLRAYFDASIAAIKNHDPKNGCLVGNFAAEASDHSEIIRKRLSEIYAELREAVAYCLKAAVKAGDLPKNFKVSEITDFIVTALQGALFGSKVERDMMP